MITPMQFKQRIYAARRKRIEQDFYAFQFDIMRQQLDAENAALRKRMRPADVALADVWSRAMFGCKQ